MHQDPWEPPDGSYPAERKSNSDASDADPSAGGETPRVPSPLLYWQVVEQYTEQYTEQYPEQYPEQYTEIDGEATLIEETELEADSLESVTASPSASPSPLAPLVQDHLSSAHGTQASATRATIRDHQDDVVVAGMLLRRVTVLPGEVAAFEVNIANHGRWSALFEISVEGWIDETWTPDLPLRVQLEPGARRVVTVTIQPPRQADCHAGDHALVVVVRAARYPGHVTRLAATLVVERFAALKLGMPQPREVEVSWFVPAARLRLPVTNQSNYAATIHLQGMDRERHCDFTFYTGGDYTGGTYTDGSSEDDGIIGAAHVTLQPGQTVTVPVEIRTRQRPFVGLLPRVTIFRLVARMDTEPPLRRAVEGEVAVAALVGPWQMAIAAVLGVVAIFGTGLAGLALLVALRSTSPTNTAPPVATVAPAPPVVAFVIQMEQPMPTRVPGTSSRDNSAPLAPQGAAEPVNAAPVIPVVSADQVTAPGEPTPVGQPQLRPVVVTTPAAHTESPAPMGSAPPANPVDGSSATMSYGQMFKQVASQFDLDWRLLAAQAYLESGFDSLALSGQGDMGLMQIRPGTWNEWAPTVEASDPFDSHSNVLVGAAYLNYLREQLSARGRPEQQWMLVAYNWGPDKVFDHLDAGGTWETLDAERRQYADDVLRIAASIPPS